MNNQHDDRNDPAAGTELRDTSLAEPDSPKYITIGLTKRQHAAIALQVPDSGSPWLDEMIRESLRQKAAMMAMHVELTTCSVPGPAHEEMIGESLRLGVEPVQHMALNAFEVANAMFPPAVSA